MVNRWGGKKYLIETKPGFVYVRKGGKYLGRITAPYPSSEFDRQYWDILTGRAVECKTSWSALIASYRRSDRWTRLKVRTRGDYEKVLIYIEEKNGNRDATRTIRKDVIAAMEANRHRTRFANYVPQVMSVLFEHAIDLGWMKDNPAKGVRRLSVPQDRAQPHIPWPDWAVKKWRAEASPLPRLIFEIGVGSVQRPSDWTLFRWNDYDGESLRIVQGKSDKSLWLPCTAELKTALDSASKNGLTILTRPDGSPMDYRYMSRVMARERKRLDLMAYDLHALRYRGVMELAWAGCDDDEIASYSGHSSKEMIRKYAGEARQMMRARQAWEKRQ
ncbi:tyrosine-type recombinase/integrase [Psychromarinibacter sp. C21-152]|uniref:Tyrosine-type recombinase/integrase n=1 Tax=Psychromarinibacter sediminicola TaxID=3033385 RepID=A0AAE3NPY8_9RHOB|nr:tyrosine-type recombinase/integrase [Psychromarinibacter sediminicola]MDF0599907.1 tyrosine-type recombinase/integrase [Psychromarinibacter sediminicola]